MMKNLTIAFLAGVLISCGSGNSDSDNLNKTKEAETSFNRLYASFTTSFDEHGDMEKLKKSADSLVIYFNIILEQKEPSEHLSDLYFSIAQVSMKVDRAKEAIQYFDAIETKFPTDDKVSKSLYLKGHTYEDILKDTAQAVAAYKHLYKTYPESEWSQNAKNQVLHLNNPSADQE